MLRVKNLKKCKKTLDFSGVLAYNLMRMWLAERCKVADTPG